jgi:hypothetical protein
VSIDDQEKYIRDYVDTTRSHFATYHNHKEQLSYLATGLYLTLTLAVFFQKSCDPPQKISSPFLVFVAMLIFTVLTYQFVRRQLLLRSVADRIIAACDKKRLEWLRAFPLDVKLYTKIYTPYTWLRIPFPGFLHEKISTKETSSVVKFRRIILSSIWFDFVIILVRLFWF